jgi:hypothetical protein
MKKYIFTVLIILSTVNIYTQEMQLSGGTDFGVGIFSVNNNFWFNSGSDYFYCKENTTSAFFAPGISFSVRVFLDDNTTSRGFVFRDRVIFITNEKKLGTLTIGNSYYQYSEKISETYSILDDSLTSIMDFGLGQSIRFKISDKLQFYTDLGVNLTWMDSEDYETDSTFNYLGAGIFSNIALQINFTSKIYLELGLNSIINIFSSQNGKIQMPGYNIKTEYEDTGRWDLISAALYIHIGWRLNIRELESNLLK